MDDDHSMADSSQDSPVNEFDDADGDDSASSITTRKRPPLPSPRPQDDEIWRPEQIQKAFTFIDLVRDTIKDPLKLSNFMQVLLDFNAKRISEAEVCERAKELLKDYPNLLPGLSAFLLPTLTPIPGEKKTKEEANRFLEKVEIRFQNNKNIHNAFLKLMENFCSSKISMVQVVEEVSNLFVGYEDLIKEFKNFIKGK